MLQTELAPRFGGGVLSRATPGVRVEGNPINCVCQNYNITYMT